MANFIDINYIHKGNKNALPEYMYKMEISRPENEYINLDTIESISKPWEKTIFFKSLYSEAKEAKEYNIFYFKTISGIYYFCLEEEFSKFINKEEQEDNKLIK